MDPEFWEQRWRDGRIGFHRDTVNPRLEQYLPRLGLAAGDRVLVPLCGKSRDLVWLAHGGHPPVGVELSRVAVESLFTEGGIAAEVAPVGPLECWHGGGIEVYCGDYFAVQPEQVRPVAAAWDRAALIALPPALRAAYARHTARLLPPGARVLLITITYADAEIAGPPFSVPATEVASIHAPWFHVAALEAARGIDPPGDLARQGLTAIEESVWLLERNDTAVPDATD